MNAGEIEVGQTYRVTATVLKVKGNTWPLVMGHLIYISQIAGNEFIVEAVGGGWTRRIYRDEVHLFERVGFHPDWPSILQERNRAAIEYTRHELTDAEASLADIPNEIRRLEFEVTSLKAKLIDLIEEREQLS